MGLAETTELDKKQLALWKKRRKAAGEKPLIRQLSIQAQSPAFEDVEGRNTKQTTIYTVAGKWGLDMGDLSVHRRADLLDPIHGRGGFQADGGLEIVDQGGSSADWAVMKT